MACPFTVLRQLQIRNIKNDQWSERPPVALSERDLETGERAHVYDTTQPKKWWLPLWNRQTRLGVKNFLSTPVFSKNTYQRNNGNTTGAPIDSVMDFLEGPLITLKMGG